MDGAMLRQWAAVEHNRLHCAEEWPDGPHKQAVIAAIHATLESLFENSGTSTRLSECMACAARKKILRPRPALASTCLRHNYNRGQPPRQAPHQASITTMY